MQDRLTLQVDGQEVSASVEGRMHLADFLREELLKTGTHLGCEQGVCGACTVFVNGRPTRSCITLRVNCLVWVAPNALALFTELIRKPQDYLSSPSPTQPITALLRSSRCTR